MVSKLFKLLLLLLPSLGLLYPPISHTEQLGSDNANLSATNIINMAFVDHKLPYSSSQYSGFEIALAEAAFAQVKLKLVTHFFDNDKLSQALERGRVDAIAPAFNWNGNFFESNTFISYFNFAITKKKRKINLESIKDISHYHSAAWKNAHLHLGDEFNKIFKPKLNKKGSKYSEISNQVSQCRMFWLDRIDIIIIDKSIFSWCKLQLARVNTNETVEIHPLFKSPTNYPVLFRSKALRDKFNKGLKIIRDSGQYQLIIDRHLASGLIK